MISAMSKLLDKLVSGFEAYFSKHGLKLFFESGSFEVKLSDFLLEFGVLAEYFSMFLQEDCILALLPLDVLIALFFLHSKERSYYNY